MTPGPPVGKECLAAVVAELRKTKDLGDRAMAQVRDEELFVRPAGGANSVAILVQHLAGNMRSRWTDVFTTDGEKPDRDRDREFVPAPGGREAVVEAWERGWGYVFRFVESLEAGDLGRVIQVRKAPHTVLASLVRQVGHYAYHVGQIVYLAKTFRGEAWESLSIPPGRSAEFLP